MPKLLLNFRRHSSSFSQLLRKLDLSPYGSKPNAGVFYGKWCGSGPVIDSVNPATNEVIAQVQTVSVLYDDDYLHHSIRHLPKNSRKQSKQQKRQKGSGERYA